MDLPKLHLNFELKKFDSRVDFDNALEPSLPLKSVILSFFLICRYISGTFTTANDLGTIRNEIIMHIVSSKDIKILLLAVDVYYCFYFTFKRLEPSICPNK